jgi:FkbM family methyltransferase
VFFDVGANVGIVTLAASRWVGPHGRVYSFEPSEREYARLRDNLELNPMSNVTSVRAALSSQAGHVSLRVAAPAYAGLNTLGEHFAYDGIDTAGLETVESITIDEFVQREGIVRVSAIKLDIEGSEGAALAGGRRVLQEHRPALILEVSARALAANNWTASQLQHLLHAAEYQLFLIDEQTASLIAINDLANLDGQNVAALPREWHPVS